MQCEHHLGISQPRPALLPKARAALKSDDALRCVAHVLGELMAWQICFAVMIAVSINPVLPYAK